jgi:hypothetical protein
MEEPFLQRDKKHSFSSLLPIKDSAVVIMSISSRRLLNW